MAQETKNEATPGNNADGSGQKAAAAVEAPQSVGKKVLSDISIAQITASALAAVTAMLFSSQIGLAGTAIGVAASAAVTALSSSIYKSFIEGTKQKAAAQVAKNASGGNGASRKSQANAGASGNGTGAGGASPSTSATPYPAQTTAEFKRAVYSHDQREFAADSDKYTHAAAKADKGAVSGSFNVVNKKWFAIVLLTVIGLATVFLTAHIINTATSGEGLGTKTAPIVRVESSSSSTASTSSSSAAAASSSSSGSSTASSSSSSSSTASTSTSSASQAAGTSSSSANGAGAGSSSSNAGGAKSSGSSAAGSSSAAQSAKSASTSSSSSTGASSSSSSSDDDDQDGSSEQDADTATDED